MISKSLSHHWKLFCAVSFFLGITLRLVWLGDMEYKADERYMFERWMALGATESFQWIGMPSGVQIQNPGLSVWVFYFLGWVTQAGTPVELCTGVALLNIIAIALLGAVIIYCVLPQLSSTQTYIKNAWLWTFCLVNVNPIALLYQRKLWAQSTLPFFCVLLFWFWMNRKKNSYYSFAWGLLGALLGQIHMSGYFVALGLLIWTSVTEQIKLKPFIAGSVLGMVPMIPWIIEALTADRISIATSWNWRSLVEIKFLAYWIMQPLGLHLEQALGGNMESFMAWPKILSFNTYLIGVCHGVILLMGLLLLARGAGWLIRVPKMRELLLNQEPSSTYQNALFLAYGTLLSLSGAVVRRHYMIITFPFQWFWVSRLALLWGRHAQLLLSVIWITQLIVSLGFLSFIHQHQGAPLGDYGIGFAYQ